MPARSLDEAKVPAHVAWVADVEGPVRPGDDEASGRAVLALVDAALGLGVRWLSLQEPSRGAALARRADELAGRGVVVLDGAAPTTGSAAPGAPGLRVVVVPPHSGRSGFVEALQRLAASGVGPSALDEGVLAASLGVPDVDLLVVTGGDRRVPDLLLWQVAYSEIVFLPEPWPQAGAAQLEAAVEQYRRRDRRYGGLVVSA